MKTNEQQKAECIKYLEDLIKDIKKNENADNYVVIEDLLERNSDGYRVESVMRYAITRSEYFIIKE